MLVRIVLMLMLLFPAMVDFAQAHISKKILACPVFAPLGPFRAPFRLNTNVTENGLYAELYDVNGDKKVDVVTYSATDGEIFANGEPRHKTEPIFYEVDEDGDGEGDALYIDIHGEQRCEDLILYSEENARGGKMM